MNKQRDLTTSNLRKLELFVLCLVLAACTKIVVVVVWQSQKVPDAVQVATFSTKNSSTAAPEDRAPQSKPSNLCKDPDADPSDPIERTNILNCRCGPPDKAVTSTVHKPPKWKRFHQTWLESIQSVVNSGKQPDVCLIGDSLVEHWNGTVGLGKKGYPHFRATFEHYFHTEHLHGMALGASADTSRMLLWHLQHGILENTQFQPKIWLILIGTNDLGHGLCSKQSTLDEILYVADILKKARPNASILIHGLLPRGGDSGNNKYQTLGRYWKMIQWINEQLQQAVEERPDFHYMDSGDLFISGDGQGMNADYVEDGIHPEAAGLHVWGPRIVGKVQSILQQQQTQ